MAQLFNKYITSIRRHMFRVSLIVIICITIFLRFTNYQNRWGLAYDQAHDAIIARYALQHVKIPLVGPFSSAGPFQTGGEWYWFIMAATALYSHVVLTPWVVLTGISVLFVVLIILLGKEMYGTRFGIMVGLLTAFSTAQIDQSLNLTNQSLLAITSLLSLWSSLGFIRTKKPKHVFFLGLWVSLGITIHFQGTALLLLIFWTFVITGIPTHPSILALFAGLFLPLIPLLYFDIQNQFTNVRGLAEYLLHVQYNVSYNALGRRWLTYIGTFWPKEWAHVIGGFAVLGYVMTIPVALLGLYTFIRGKISKEWFLVFATFISIVIVIRYTRTPLFSSYLVFLHPFIFLLSGWLLYMLYRWKHGVGILFTVIVVSGSLYQDIQRIVKADNFTAQLTIMWENELTNRYPGKQFSLYDYKYDLRDKTLPLVLFLDVANKIEDNSMKIGIDIVTGKETHSHPLLFGDKGAYQFYDLSGSTSAELTKNGWVFINPSAIYRATQEWYSK